MRGTEAAAGSAGQRRPGGFSAPGVTFGPTFPKLELGVRRPNMPSAIFPLIRFHIAQAPDISGKGTCLVPRNDGESLSVWTPTHPAYVEPIYSACCLKLVPGLSRDTINDSHNATGASDRNILAISADINAHGLFYTRHPRRPSDCTGGYIDCSDLGYRFPSPEHYDSPSIGMC